MTSKPLAYTLTMRGVLRIVLAWLLVLALPVQGVAAQAMLFCGPMHSTMAFGSAAPTVAPTHHDHALHEHGASPAAAATEAHAHTQEASTQPVSSAEMSSATCSVCASCCSMAAIATALVVPDALSFSPVYTLSPFEPHASLAAGGLERPPKLHLA
ncbi:hypothetical protein [Methylibium sp.]|uniref:hypothetical protein n=1 Tax=Methylibium sp. TaxID=2067992 RepID=UPI0017B77033|nr:hypothetical protein [Methylibium sp.]MBA3589791.1 hypothetical protein [Methylibium sp.]